MSKEKTRQQADRANPQQQRTPSEELETGESGSTRGQHENEAETSHPSQHGGGKHELDERRRRGT